MRGVFRPALLDLILLLASLPALAAVPKQPDADIMAKLASVRACAMQQGVILPDPSQSGAAPATTMDGQQQAVVQACMVQNGLGHAPETPRPPTPEERAKIDSVRACTALQGVHLPGLTENGGLIEAPLTENQQDVLRDCLRQNGVNIPQDAAFLKGDAPITPDEVQKYKTVADCAAGYGFDMAALVKQSGNGTPPQINDQQRHILDLCRRANGYAPLQP